MILHRLQYMNHGGLETLVGNFTVDTDATDLAGIRWFELRRTAGGAWAPYQEVAMIKAGEDANRLPLAVDDVIHIIKSRKKIKGAVTKAMVYPTVGMPARILRVTMR